MNPTRRQFNASALVWLSASAALPSCDAELAVDPNGPFQHGVASGDPRADRVILWTRVTTEAAEAVSVSWEVSQDRDFAGVVRNGTVITDETRDYTVKVDATGLRPSTTYYYRFTALGVTSTTGRTKTLPTGSVTRVRLAVASCSNIAAGFFNAYALIATRELDAVVHLGDYLYEYANESFGDGSELGRVPEPDREIVSLSDYRARHAQYKADPDLQEAHRRHPWICVWDDHESANDAYRDGAQNHQATCPDDAPPRQCTRDEGSWQKRKAASIQAYLEWMPIREQSGDDGGRIYRSFPFGELCDLVMLDTRLVGRDKQPTDGTDNEALRDPSRSLLGATQHDWLEQQLEASQQRGAVWRVLGQQVMMGSLKDTIGLISGAPAFVNLDQWDGYQASRERVLQHIDKSGIDNVVVLTGDIHSSWANELAFDPFDTERYDPDSSTGSLAVEFVTTSITSEISSDLIPDPELVELVVGQTQPHVKYVNLQRRGYLLLDLTPERVRGRWYFVKTIKEPLAEEELGASWQCQSRTNRLEEA